MKTPDNITKDFIRNSFWSFLLSIINRAGGLILTIVMARILLPASYGIYSIILSTAMIFYTFTDLGINTALVHYVSSYLNKDSNKLRAYYQYLFKLKFFLTLIASIALIALAYPIAFFIFKNPLLITPLIISGVYIFAMSFEGFFTQIFYCIEKVHYISFKESLNQILRIAFITGFLLIAAKTSQQLGIFAIMTLVSILMIIYSYVYTKKLLPFIYKKSEKEIELQDKKKILKFVGYLTIASISSVFFSYIDSILLAIFVSPEYVGFYRAAFSLVLGISGLLGFFIPLMLPVLSKVESSKKSKIINSLIKYMVIILIPSILGLICLGKYFIVLFYGYAYLPAASLLYILAVLILPTVVINMFLMLFSSEERPEIFAKLILITVIINIILNFILIKSLLSFSQLNATLGAALAATLSYVFYFFGAVYYLKKELKILIDFRTMIKPALSAIVMSAFILVGLRYMGNFNALKGLLAVISSAIIYFLALLILRGITKKDIELVTSFIKGKKFI